MNPSQGYFVDYRSAMGEEARFRHSFCGPQSVDGAWCPNCRKPLLRFLALDTRDPRLHLQGSPFPTLSLLFCWTCSVAQEPLFYRILDDGGVELLRYGAGGVEADFPYEDYPLAFPGARAALREITADQQRTLMRLNRRFEDETQAARIELIGHASDLWRVRHQIGGEPFLIQEALDLECPVCGGAMPLLASVADDCLDPRGMAGDEGVQVLYHYCRGCCVAGVYQRCD